MLVHEEFITEEDQTEDELINLGWVEALQWVLTGDGRFEEMTKRDYPEEEPHAIIKTEGVNDFKYHYNSTPCIDTAKEDYDKIIYVDNVMKRIDEHEDKELES
jgi:hypothetical protein